MKTDDKLKIENLESDLFIEDLGKIQGGQSTMTTMALGEEDSGLPFGGGGPADGPGFGYKPYDYSRMIDEIMDSVYPRKQPGVDYGSVTTLAIGEE